jgi:RNA polymerase sigma-70 factor (ECF subfamily)
MTTLMAIQTLYSSLDDTRLAAQARSDPEAFAELYRRHVLSIYRYHLAHTGNVRDAEDLTSQTFTAALEGIRSYRGTAPYITWLVGIASRKRLLFFRRDRNRAEISLDAALHVPASSLPTDRAAAQRLRTDQILGALKTLSPDRAEALILCFFSGLSPREAGLVLGKSEAAVRMLISRGLQDLRSRTSLAMEVDDE